MAILRNHPVIPIDSQVGIYSLPVLAYMRTSHKRLVEIASLKVPRLKSQVGLTQDELPQVVEAMMHMAGVEDAFIPRKTRSEATQAM